MLGVVRAAESGSAIDGALNYVIDAAVAAGSEATSSLSFALSKVVNLPQTIADMRSEPKALMKGYGPFGKLSIEKWFAQYWDKVANWFKYPPDKGFDNGVSSVYVPKEGEEMDRFGSPTGQFLSPRDGTPFTERALPPSNVSADTTDTGPGYHVYKWIKDWDPSIGTIKAGKIAPWFDQPGGGTQYLLPDGVTVQYLIENDYIEDITPTD